jgi:chemotaxis protein methyltransferase CheR
MTAVQETLLEKTSILISKRTGLNFPQNRLKDLERAFTSVAKELKFEQVEDCIKWFLEEPMSQEKIDKIVSVVTIGETYFFRENRCFEVLEKIIIPQIIGKGYQNSKNLRIWSAGCATGEEPYSIAIMLHRMRGQLKDWDVSIQATDINIHSLGHAMKGIYSTWSFRNTPDWLQKNYFREVGEGRYEVSSEIRQKVNFAYLNLAENTYPSLLNETNALDIIFCRNVLMYFTPEHIKETLERFKNCLKDDGWLILSACENFNVMISNFSAVYYPGVILYQKTPSVSSPSVIKASQLVSKVVPPIITTFPSQIKIPPIMIKRTAAVIPVSETLIKDYQSIEEIVKQCRISANEGRLEEALMLSEKAINLDKLCVSTHYLHAMILLEQDKKEEATLALRRVLYLDSKHIVAHFMLGNIARSIGQNQEAKQHFLNALELLEKSPSQTELEDSEGLQVEKLAQMIRITVSTL